MIDQHPAVAHLLAAHERAVALAAAGTPGPWEPEGDDPTDDEVYTVHDGKHGDLVGEVVAYVRGGNWRGGADRTVQNMQLIATFADPVAVLMRVAEERNILAGHEGTWASGEPEYGHHHEVMVGPSRRTRYVDVDNDEPDPPYMCITCEAPGYPCRTVIGLARAWGWKESTDG